MLKSHCWFVIATALLPTACNSQLKEQNLQNGTAEDRNSADTAFRAEAEKVGAKYLAQYPPIDGSNTYTVPPDQAKMYISTLTLPSGFILKVDPKTPPLEWTVGQLEVSENTTFDLSGSQIKPPTPDKIPAKSQKTDKCHGGDAGVRGTPGRPGEPGRPLTMRIVNGVSNTGALWIRTDGGVGGDGGDGQDGQQGGGPRNHVIIDQCSAGDGGPGGPGGFPGKGGPVAKVTITLGNSTTPFAAAVAPPPACAPSKRPSGSEGKTGVIQIYGAVGCDGKVGKPGNRGPNG